MFAPFSLSSALSGRATVYRMPDGQHQQARLGQTQLFGETMTFVRIGLEEPRLLTDAIAASLGHPLTPRNGWINIFKNDQNQYIAGNKIFNTRELAQEARPTAIQTQIQYFVE